MLSKELLIEQLKTFQTKEVPTESLPDGVGPLYVRSCSEADVEWVLKDMNCGRSRMLCVTLCDTEGVLAFERKELQIVKGFSFEILDAVWKVAAALNGIAVNPEDSGKN